tara:strand:+ start:1186 stop:1803 length:618 start_codon:yes stop_codon:yes gene_type:complete
MAIPVSELQKINPNSIIELFELQLVEGLHYATGNPSNVPTIYRFHSGVNLNSNADIIWQSNTYQRFPIEASGFEYSGTGQIPRPKLTMANLGGISRLGSVIRVTDLLLSVNLITQHNDLLKAQVKRITTTADNLDAANFSGGTNPYGTPSSDENPQEIFEIDRKVTESRAVVEFELVSKQDLQHKKLPARQVTRKDFPGVGSFIN